MVTPQGFIHVLKSQNSILNKQYHIKELLKSFHLNVPTTGFLSRTRVVCVTRFSAQVSLFRFRSVLSLPNLCGNVFYTLNFLFCKIKREKVFLIFNVLPDYLNIYFSVFRVTCPFPIRFSKLAVFFSNQVIEYNISLVKEMLWTNFEVDMRLRFYK